MWFGGGKIVLEFWGNQSLKKKRAELQALIYEVRKQFNSALSEIEDFDDLERCVLGLALVGSTEKATRAELKKLLDFIDSHAFARVIVEDTDVFAFD